MTTTERGTRKAADIPARSFYLLDHEQSADLEELEMALDGLAAIIFDEPENQFVEMEVPRRESAALIRVLARRLHDTRRGGDLPIVWLDHSGKPIAHPMNPA